MIVLLILAILILLIVGILASPFSFSYIHDDTTGERAWSLSVFGKIIVSNEKRDILQRFQKPPRKKKPEKQPPAQQPEKKRDVAAMVQTLLPAIPKSLRRLCRGIHFHHVTFGLCIGGADAYETALRYGRACAVVYPLIEVAQRIFPIHFDAFQVTTRFGFENSLHILRFQVTFRPAAAVAAGISFLGGVIATQLQKRRAENPSGGEQS